MSQPTLTVQIQQLESAVGVRLFDRNKRHVALTQAGRELLMPLERILIDVEAIATSTEELREHRRGLVTVAVRGRSDRRADSPKISPPLRVSIRTFWPRRPSMDTSTVPSASR